MQIAISSRKTVVTHRLEEVIRDKIGRLDKFLEGMDHAEVHLSEEKNPRLADRKEVCEVSMSGHGHRVRCKVAAPDAYKAVDLAVEKLEHQLHKLKVAAPLPRAGQRPLLCTPPKHPDNTLVHPPQAPGPGRAAGPHRAPRGRRPPRRPTRPCRHRAG